MVDFFSIDTLLPFMLVLAVAYGGLEASKIFRNNALKAIISVVVAFFAISNAGVTEMITAYMPYAALFFIGFFVLSYASRMLSGQGRDNTMIVLILVLLLVFASSYVKAGSVYWDEGFLWAFGLIIVLAVIYGAYKKRG